MNQDKKVAIVVARFNGDITQNLLEGAKDCAIKEGYPLDQLSVYWVPGAFELPLIAKKLAKTNQYDAIVCLGAVLQGETKHFDYVSSATANGIMQASLDQEIPILFGVLTSDRSQALVRSSGDRNKGFHTFKAALDMIDLCTQVHQNV